MQQTQFSNPIPQFSGCQDNLGSQICNALLQTTNNDHKARSSAEQFMSSIAGQAGLVQNLLEIATNHEAQVQVQAAIYLKNLVNSAWNVTQSTPFAEKENVIPNSNQFSQLLSPQDRDFLRLNIVSALDHVVHLSEDPQSKVIVSSIENIIYNIAQCDYEIWAKSCLHANIQQRLQAGDERSLISGLRTLKAVLQAFEFEIHEERKPLNQMVEFFFPILEGILGGQVLTQSSNYISLMILVGKIFFMANQIEVSPFFMNNTGRIAPWVDLFTQYLDQQLSTELITPTEDMNQIQALNKCPEWRLKGILAQITLKLFQKYQLLSVDVRSGSKVKTGRLNQDRFFTEFDQSYAGKLCNSHLNILLSKKEQFVGTKTLNSALRFVSMALKTNKMRNMCQPHIQTILYDLTLPLLLVSQYEMCMWQQNTIEYVRLQVDHSNSWNVKRTNQEMIKAICNIRQTRKIKISPHLSNYLSMICEQMNTSHGDDFRPKEALMHAFGLLSTHMAQSVEYQKHAGQVLMQYVMPELQSANAFLRARACWVYGEFGMLRFEEPGHLHSVLDSLYQNLQNKDLPVRVNAAVSLIRLLDHEFAVEFVRPGLGQIIKIYLKLIDDIEYDELIESLKRIVEVFENEIGPYAIDLCSKLGEAYLRVTETQRSTQGGGAELEEDSETSLTADGLITAIRRILKSISGMNLQLYPQLEEILEQPIIATLTDQQATSVDEGLSCLSELLYNQQGVSGRMWNIYLLIADSLLTDKGILDEYIEIISVPLINFMNKDPVTFKTAMLEYRGQKVTCLDIFCQVIGKCLQLQRDKNDEISACCVISLVIAMLENIPEISSVVPGIIDMFFNEINQGVKTREYHTMILQGFMMCIYYDCGSTLQAIESAGRTDWLVSKIFEIVMDLSEDFEVKRFMLGLSSLLAPIEMPAAIANNYTNVMKALVYLSQKSCEIFEKSQQTKEKEAMAEVEEEGAIIEDEDYDEIDIESDEDDEEWDGSEDEDGQNDLYNSPLDDLNEVVFFHQKMANLQNDHKELYDYLCAQLSPEDGQTLGLTLQAAQHYVQQQQLAKSQNQ